MVDDKYIGLILAISGSVLIGTSFIITKKGLNDAARRNAAYGVQSASENLAYLKNPIWWLGLTTSRLGCTLCLIGSLIIVLHAPEDKDVQTVEEYLSYALRPGFLMYCFTVLVFTLIMVYAVAPKYGRSNPLIYISICSLVGSISVMAIKGFGVAVKLTFGGKNQFSHPDTYVLGIIVALCILVQMNYFNRALDIFSTNVVNPMYFVGFSTCTATASLILFQGFNTTDATNTVSLLTGFAVTFMGVHLLNLSRQREPALGEHSTLEGGLMNPRLSLQGRMSLDGWNGDTRIGPAPSPRRHGRQNSLYRNQSTTLLFDEHDSDAVGLQRLREEESDDDIDVDERTRLKKGGGPPPLNGHATSGRQSGSRSHSHSPIPSRATSATDVRIALPTLDNYLHHLDVPYAHSRQLMAGWSVVYRGLSPSCGSTTDHMLAIAQTALRRSTRFLFPYNPDTKRQAPITTMGAAGNHTVDTSKRLTDLRELMARKEHDVQAFVVPSEDQQYKDVPTWQDFLSKNLESSTRIGIDATLISATDAKTISKALESKGSTLVPIQENLVDAVWSDRPARPHKPIIHLDEKYSGQSPGDKIKALREELAKKKYQAFVVNMLDEVAWLFNLRGSDIDYNPELFVEKAQLTKDALKYLGDNVNIQPYDAFFKYLKQLPNNLSLDEERKVLIGDKASLAIAHALGQDKYTIGSSPVADLKAIKNATELEGFRQSHIRDGAALAQYFSWLEQQLNNGVELNESQGADQLEKFRSSLALFSGLSFDTISSTGPNGAIIHYSPDPNDCAIIKKDQIYLCDSGAQFLDGTTDVTRTWHFGIPTDEEKRAFTRVLQGHIAIDTAIFPTGPHGIGVRIAYNNTPLKAGMTVSNEPGYYADGKFGIRIESIVLVREAKTLNNFGDKGYLGFEHVTLCPIQKTLVNTELLSSEERNWLNSYHAETWAKVSPLLKNDEGALKWLERETSPLAIHKEDKSTGYNVAIIATFLLSAK
ncbi:hypothetical protein DXG03_005901 [Asterophora parasitica]|uniref:Xaa-Pro aminopeptidase P n=1 Tax=Asterophora parasitica TaxID=117018 RepID=A0A9P7KCE1_9AGAR|nr:hypothetical protein DXG03_005901 [Asterophora parasitica]